ncbi:hypothetical protein [Salinivibrio costicola]|uniref:hypothetical protein n=1 Tax=Salinivibrio costicola TaxID=51367 RepID=UPI003F6FCD60
MGVLSKLIKKNISAMVEGVKLPFNLIKLFHCQTNVQYVKISINIFFSKFINMAVMFMPLKLLFVLTGTKNIEILAQLEEFIGRNKYIALVLGILFILYMVNVFLQIYRAKLINKQKYSIENRKYYFGDRPVTVAEIRRTYASFCQVIADMAVILMVCAVLFIADQLLALYYIAVFGVFSLIYEQWVFSKHETKLMKKLDIEKKSFIQAVSMVMFLVIFLGLVLVVISTGMSAIKAILLLLLMRLANGAFKSYLSCHMKLRECYL